MFPRRSWVLLAVAVGLLVAGLILQQFAGDGGASPPDVPDSELTPAATTGGFGLPGPSPTAGAGTATAPSAATTAQSRDLSIDEESVLVDVRLRTGVAAGMGARTATLGHVAEDSTN